MTRWSWLVIAAPGGLLLLAVIGLVRWMLKGEDDTHVSNQWQRDRLKDEAARTRQTWHLK